MEENNDGLMWHDSDVKKSLAEKMVLAVAAYKRRFCGASPTAVKLHPGDYPEIKDGFVIAGMVVSRSKYTPRAHYFLFSMDATASLQR